MIRHYEYRGFRISVQRIRKSGHWQGMAKGLGTVILTRKPDHEMAGDARYDLERQLDALFAKGLGVFAK